MNPSVVLFHDHPFIIQKSSSIIARLWSSIWWLVISNGLVWNSWVGTIEKHGRNDGKGTIMKVNVGNQAWTGVRQEPSLTHYIMNCVWLAGIHHLMMMLCEKRTCHVWSHSTPALDPKPWPFVGYRTKVAGFHAYIWSRAGKHDKTCPDSLVVEQQ